jgi:predicted transcriptional regulator
MTMKRTQIQLDEETYSTVKRLAYESGRSFSSVVRETLDRSLGVSARKRRTRSRQFAFVGAGRSVQRGSTPVSERHDEALAEALLEKKARR